MSAARPAVSDFDAGTDDLEHVVYVVEWDAPDIPLVTIPCIDRLLEYCDALEAVVSSERDNMQDDVRQSVVTMVSELRGYIQEVAAAEIDELCDLTN